MQHPSYEAPSLKATLLSRVKQLQSCADTVPIVAGQCTTIGDSITIEGVKCDVSQQQKELTKKVAEELQVDSTEAFKIVYQQSRTGVTSLEGLVSGFMLERTALLRVVKYLFIVDSSTEEVQIKGTAQGVLTKLNEEKEFTLKLVQGVRNRVNQQMPPKAAIDSSAALVWSRQVYYIPSQF